MRKIYMFLLLFLWSGSLLQAQQASLKTIPAEREKRFTEPPGHATLPEITVTGSVLDE